MYLPEVSVSSTIDKSDVTTCKVAATVTSL